MSSTGYPKSADALQTHLETGHTTIARCWIITRQDGEVLGFTDHDFNIELEGATCRAMHGLTATTLSTSTGLAVDHTEALGAISDDGLTEEDILAGRYDGAEVKIWKVNWANKEAKRLIFRGEIGEIARAGSGFRVELRGLSAKLNQPLGSIYQKPCSAILGDTRCKFDLETPGYRSESAAISVDNAQDFVFPMMENHAEGWFARGRLVVLTGQAQGAERVIKYDRFLNGQRLIGIWEPIDAPLDPEDQFQLEAGCDKRMETCQLKFNNILNFRGFPDIPGEDWFGTAPSNAIDRSGGSIRRTPSSSSISGGS